MKNKKRTFAIMLLVSTCMILLINGGYDVFIEIFVEKDYISVVTIIIGSLLGFAIALFIEYAVDRYSEYILWCERCKEDDEENNEISEDTESEK